MESIEALFLSDEMRLIGGIAPLSQRTDGATHLVERREHFLHLQCGGSKRNRIRASASQSVQGFPDGSM